MESLNNVIDKKPTEEIMEEITGFQVELVDCADLPAIVLDHFESNSSKYIHPDNYVKGNFEKIFKITQSEDEVKYIAQQDKTYNTNGDTERIAYLVDTRGEDVTGYLEMRLGTTNLNDYFVNKPFVGFTRTNEGFLREGLAYKRLIEANDYSVAEHGHVLNSDSLMREEARKVWEKLEVEGKVERYDEGEKVRFRFRN